TRQGEEEGREEARRAHGAIPYGRGEAAFFYCPGRPGETPEENASTTPLGAGRGGAPRTGVGAGRFSQGGGAAGVSRATGAGPAAGALGRGEEAPDPTADPGQHVLPRQVLLLLQVGEGAARVVYAHHARGRVDDPDQRDPRLKVLAHLALDLVVSVVGRDH